MTKPRTQSPTVRRERESKVEYLGGSVGDRVKVASLPASWMGFLGHGQRRTAANGHRKRRVHAARKARAVKPRPRRAKARAVKPRRRAKARAHVKRTRPVRPRSKGSKRRR